MEKYPKLNSNDKCAFSKRDICNYDEKNKRCIYMKYNNSKSIFDTTRWECTYNHTNNDKKQESLTKEIK